MHQIHVFKPDPQLLVKYAAALGGSVKVEIIKDRKDRPKRKVVAIRTKRRRLSHTASMT
jgi:hypothetical protein